MEIQNIPVFFELGGDQVRIGRGDVVGVCDCSPQYCCCPDEEKRKILRIEVGNEEDLVGFLESLLTVHQLEGVFLSFMYKKSTREEVARNETNKSDKDLRNKILNKFVRVIQDGPHFGRRGVVKSMMNEMVEVATYGMQDLVISRHDVELTDGS